MFESFFFAGFECAVGINRHGEWFDQIAATQHDLLVDDDYARLSAAGLRCAREAIRWPIVDRNGKYDFSSVELVIEAARRHDVKVIFDLFHFGYPAGLDPFSSAFVDAFAEYAAACARYVRTAYPESCYFTPVNEPSYFAWAGGEVGHFAPHARGRGPELKANLCRAAIRAVDAIREQCPAARIVNVDPICHVVAPPGNVELEEEARRFNEGAVFESFDMISGRVAPELGGSPQHLDIVGINYYWTNQWEIGSAPVPLADDDPRRVSLADLIRRVWRRYDAEILVTETAHVGDRRADWIGEVTDDVESVLLEGAPVRGVCLYPVLGMPEWHDRSTWTRMGLWDVETRRGVCERSPHEPAMRSLEAARSRLEPIVRARAASALDDSRRLCEFVYRNLGSITQIFPTLDTHQALQIFHPVLLLDADGRPPEPFTSVSAEDVASGRWRVNPAAAEGLGLDPAYAEEHLRYYTEALEAGGKYSLTIWPFHAQRGGIGHALVPAVEEAVFFHTAVRYTPAGYQPKGDNPLTEHYSMLGPEVEVDREGEPLGRRNQALIEELLRFDAVVIAGQAKSHCVAWTIQDLLEDPTVQERGLEEKVYLLEDCTSPVVTPGADYTDDADAAFARFAAAGAHVVRSTEPLAAWPGVVGAGLAAAEA